MDRGERRDRTTRYATQARKVHIRIFWRNEDPCRCTRQVGHFAKGKSVGCGCRKIGRTGSPKLVVSMCHRGDHGYHPAVVERVAGNRLTRAWMQALRGQDPLDVEL